MSRSHGYGVDGVCFHRQLKDIKMKYICIYENCNYATHNGKKEEILCHVYEHHRVKFLKHLAKSCCLVNGGDKYIDGIEKTLYFALP